MGLLQVFQTELSDRMVSNPASYSGGAGFKSLPGDWLFSLKFFVGFLILAR
jgi:hypothetical protein